MKNLLKIHASITTLSIAVSATVSFAQPAETEGERQASQARSIERIQLDYVSKTDEAASARSLARSPRIINGRPIANDAKNWEWTVSIQRRNNHWCGGAFISPGFTASGKGVVWRDDDKEPVWVVTAAHCISELELNLIGRGELSVVSGDVSLSRKDQFGKNRALDSQKVIAAYVHPDYEPDTNANDIALLKLERLENPISDRRRSIGIAQDTQQSWLYAPYTALNVMGWGRTLEGGYLSDTLQEVRVPFVEQTYCAGSYASASSRGVSAGMICAGFSSGGYDSCQGDSGGPLVYVPAPGVPSPTRSSVLAGVVSWGAGCARPNLFGVYSSALAYRGWLARTVRQHETHDTNN
ncbi:MAG: serine protease [Hoeflea sp.]|uniref:serine protease n=1 Tax=Hoeflea sp. TaxID=1940281 RepID=UPI003EF8E7CC